MAFIMHLKNLKVCRQYILLKKAYLSLHWAGGECSFVSTGDYISENGVAFLMMLHHHWPARAFNTVCIPWGHYPIPSNHNHCLA